jgi:hypothetical protein
MPFQIQYPRGVYKIFMLQLLHCNITKKGSTMFDFTKTTKQFEELAKRIQEVNEFWYGVVKDFFNTVKTK